jgi:predicted membrane channel-forming protein YqfA (hemolysin III family)
MDFSRPLVIDSTPRVRLRQIVLFLALELSILLIICALAPKSHFVEYSLFTVNRTVPTQRYSFRFMRIASNITGVWLSLFSIRGEHVARDYDNISLDIHTQSFSQALPMVNETVHQRNVQLHYPPYHQSSEAFQAITIPVNLSDRIEVMIDLTHNSSILEGIVFEWSISNPSNPIVDHAASFWFCGIATLLGLVLAIHLRRRLEQAATIMALSIFFVANLLFAVRSPLFHFFDQLMAGQLRVTLFYLIAYIGNKHRNPITRIGYLLLFLCFGVDFAFAWSRSVGHSHSVHAIGVHMCVCAVVLSIVAAMYFSADDRFCFLFYAGVLSISFGATFFGEDLPIAVPSFEHFIEPRIAFCGLYALGLTMLTHFHQGAPRAESDGDRLDGDDTSSDFDRLISS